MDSITKGSQESLFNESKKLVPGGVHSPVRSFKGMRSTPRFMKSANGAMITDIDGKDYVDFCMSFGPLILGHGNKVVKKELTEALNNGWSFGACEPYSLELAELILEKLPFDQIRFVNSGTEAVMTAIRLARGYTKKNKIIKFNGCYHGHTDAMLIKAGSGLAGTSEASSGGVPAGTSEDTLILELGDLEEVRRVFNDHKNKIAAIIVEPLPANNGLLLQTQGFLEGLRTISNENNALLIFDEVISGFRVAFGGMAARTGISPDLCTYGKIIGGGLPVGAIASSKKIMEHLAPVGNVYQAGTLSANPLAMVAGFHTLKQMTDEAYQQIEYHTRLITNLFREWFLEYNNGQFNDFKVIEHSSLFWITKDDSVSRACDIDANLSDKFLDLFELLLAKGIYLSPNAYEVGFSSLAHDQQVLQELKKRLYN
ncbi:MAG: glutamate-1-semialdehyde 2,1-aminomutase [Bacteriovoracaceae bacterium]|mgnify:CR=1 FL=1|jgi:glutamate-1-semialdehyde 2,1-aminomutase|nr:glutamate-1-semialdehyde 2,1-aminomutase [Bacteriovoracaceae bacterium]